MSKHILLIDDEADIRDLLAEVLTGKRYTVTTASTASEARAAFQRQRPDLIISDLQLPESDGTELVAWFRQTDAQVPIILLTGVLFDARAAAELLRTGVSAYLPKTCSLAEMLAEVELLAGRP